MSSSDAKRAIEAVFRIEWPRLVAGLTRLVHDVGLAEELAQDSLVIALERWPETGIPQKPGAWLMGTAKHRAIDLIRRRQTLERKQAELIHQFEIEQAVMQDSEADLDEPVEDDLLRLMFIACHPLLSREARVALTLRLLGGLTTGEIARAFLTSEATIAQRIVRAKRTLSEAEVRFELPPADQLTVRLGSVLEVVYLIFNEGYSPTAGAEWVRPELCEEALRLGRILAELAPTEAEVHGLVALMELQASRLHTRVGPSGKPILLLDQNRGRWDRLLIGRGVAALERAEALGQVSGPYQIQAAIAACHARAATADATDWRRIVSLYDHLLTVSPSPVVALNRAVAVSMADGPAAGLTELDHLNEEPSLAEYHLLPTVRGDLLLKLGRDEEAAEEFRRAAALTANELEQEVLLDRAAHAAD